MQAIWGWGELSREGREEGTKGKKGFRVQGSETENKESLRVPCVAET
jgi:hypothetical protein